MEAAIAKAKGTDKQELSAQDSIPYQRMYQDGICRVTDTFYTKTVQFQDINYQLSQNEDKTAIFEGWSDFLNYFDSSIHFQLSFLNLSTAQDGYARSVVIPMRGDKFNDVRVEYSEMLQNQLAKGNNGLTNNLIMVDRKMLKNPNGLILGTPGSGKSFSAKREILNVFLVTDDDIIICDPEAEYYPLVQRLDGQVIKISPTSRQYVNPMDLNLDYSDDENPLSLKVDFLLSFCDIVVGSKDGLQPVEKTVIDRCVRQVYQKYLSDPRPENMPVLGDLYDTLRAQTEKEAQFIATALEIYVTGSLNVFNHRTNVDITWMTSGT